MNDDKNKTEKLILDAAKLVFLEKGLKGARMQEIADKAGINKSLLHYYFRTKDKLFNIVFENIANDLFSSVVVAFYGDDDIFKKINKFTDRYIGFIKANPLLPQFMIHIIMQNPEMLIEAFDKSGIDPQKQVLEPLQKEIDKGNIIKLPPEQLIINLLSLVIFPFVAKPVIMKILKIESHEVFDEFIEERRRLLPEFIIKAIKPD
jgi:TetR/AcrR family transcriptional regulator